MVGGQSGGGGRAGGREAVFLESFVCGGVHMCSLCVCGSSGGGVQALCALCVPVPLCLQGDKYSSRSYNQGRENEEISTG